jgi:NADH:ubiquinone reductase (H+-translocating)
MTIRTKAGRPGPAEVIVVGGGYAGTLAANRLALRAGRRARITLVNPDDTFVQRLRLHQFAVGQHVAAPGLTRLLASGVAFVRARMTEFDPDRGWIDISGDDGSRRLSFDRLVLATGSHTGIDTAPGVADHARTVADRGSAARLRDDLRALGSGSRVVIVGGGLTGLETVTEIAESRPDLHATLVTGTIGDDHVTARGGRHIDVSLERLGIEVVTGARAAAVDHDRIVLADGTELSSDLTVWCGGFTCSSLAGQAGLQVDERGVVITDEMLRSVSHPQVLAAGDAGLPPLRHGARYQMTCQSGAFAGEHAAEVINDELRGNSARPFRFRYLHRHISLGRRNGVVQFTDRADRPNGAVLIGRPAIGYKELIIRATLPYIRAEGALAALRPSASRRQSAGTSPAHSSS